MKAKHYPIVFEREDSGVVSAYVAGLPVYAQGPTRSKAARAIVRTLRTYLEAHPDQVSRADVQVARVSTTAGAHARAKVNLVTRRCVGGSPYERAQGGELPGEWSSGRPATEDRK